VRRCLSIDGFLYALYATGNQAGQLKWKYYIGGGLNVTGVLSPAGDVLYGGTAVVPGSSIYAIQLPLSDSSPPSNPPPSATSSNQDTTAALRAMQTAFALLFLFTWLANVAGVFYYCRSIKIVVWPEPLLSAVFLHVRSHARVFDSRLLRLTHVSLSPSILSFFVGSTYSGELSYIWHSHCVC
jgi:hypothetical protein